MKRTFKVWVVVNSGGNLVSGFYWTRGVALSKRYLGGWVAKPATLTLKPPPRKGKGK